MKLVLRICLFSFLLPASLLAQDPQFSQFYQAPLYINPAFAGSLQSFRAGVNYRNQWPGLDANYTTFSFFADYYIADANSSIGLIAKHDSQGSANNAATYRSSDIGLIYSYDIFLDRNTVLKPALQLSYYQRQLGTDGLLFPDQFNNNGPTGAPTQENIASTNANFVDISAGILFLTDNFWGGLSAHHINRPSESFVDGENRLQTKFSLHASYRYSFEYFPLDLIPAFSYQRQGDAQQAYVGLYGVYQPIMLGVWYKGFPINRYQNLTPNNDAIVLMAGFRLDKYNLEFAYSFDATISNLSNYSSNAHELSLVFNLPNKYGTGVRYTPDIWGTQRNNGSLYHIRR